MTTKLFATRTFKDAGTKRFFAKGQELTDEKLGLSADTLVNYEHAGLAGPEPKKKSADLAEQTASDATSSATTATSTKTKA